MPHPLFQQVSSPPIHPGIPHQVTNGVMQKFPEIGSEPRAHRNRFATAPGNPVVRCIAPRAAPVAGNLPQRWFDAICAAAGLAFLAPMFAIIAIAIKLDDGGPIFYSHARIGKGFWEFRLFKFRSMIYRCAEGSTVT